MLIKDTGVCEVCVFPGSEYEECMGQFSSGMWCRVAWKQLTDVSEESTACVFCPEDKVIQFL